MIDTARILGLFSLILMLSACGKGKMPPLYDASSPVIYDNDEVVDAYTDEYLLSLAALGEIQLRGMITSAAIAPFNRWVPESSYERMVADRKKVVEAARASGFQHIPDPMRGPKGPLRKPSSGRIEDTQPIGEAGSRLIAREAKNAKVEKPLVVVVGGNLTAEADAYLLDPSIADKIVVAWVCGRRHYMGGYNGWCDGWAAYIVLQKLRLVQFDDVPLPKVRKPDILKLPASPLRDFMYQAGLDWNPPAPGEVDGDAAPAIGLRRPEFILKTRTVRFGHWATEEGSADGSVSSNRHEVPAFRRNIIVSAFYRLFNISDRGRVTVVREGDPEIPTKEWWRAVGAALAR